MATRIDDEELERARGRVRSFEDKSQKVRSSGGNLNAKGEPSLVSNESNGSKSSSGSGKSSGGGGRDEAAIARRNMQSPSIEGRTPGLGVKYDDSHITGKVGGLKGPGRQDKAWDGVGFEGAKPKEAIIRPTQLSIPAVRPRRIANQDGATSFHFSHEAISKTKYEKTTAKGTKNRKGAAKDHARYIERDGALASANEDDLDKIEKELQDIAKSDPELAERLGLDPDEKNEKKDAAEAVAGAMSVGALAGVYIEREEALAHDDKGTAVLFSNISEDPKERRDFWQEVEKREANPSEDQIRISLKGNEEFWNQITSDENCPKKLREAIKLADPTQDLYVRTGDNEEIRKLMSKHGWKPREKRPEGETDEQRAAREQRESENSFGAHFEDGRGGRVQFRVVGELPYDVPHEARIRILKGFAQEFEKRNLPFIAVMHSPDHTNDDRNWHFHLVYHDRPVKKFTGKAEDHLWELPKEAGSKIQRQYEILQSTIGSKDLEQYAGKWDFMVPWEYKKKVSRNKIETYPFAQAKNREVNNRKFIPSLRKKLAELTNHELEKAKLDRRLDPRKYSEMGIHKKADVHLGTQASRLESLGIPTQAGVINEENQWEYVRQFLEEDRKKTQQNIDNQIKRWETSIDSVDVTPEQKRKFTEEKVRWEQEARRAAEHAAISRHLDEHYERLKSRAEKVRGVAKKHLDAIREGRATKRQADSRNQYQEKHDEAEAHLLGLKFLMAEELQQIIDSRTLSNKLFKSAEERRLTIEAIIESGKQARLLRESQIKTVPVKKSLKTGDARIDDAVRNPNKPLSKGQVEAYVNRIMRNNIRVVEDKGILVPKIRSNRDNEIIASSGYDQTQAKLKTIKTNQNKLIDTLVESLVRNPRMLSTRDKNGFIEGPADLIGKKPSDVFKISTADTRLQAAWKAYADEPEVVAGLARVLARIQSQRQINAASSKTETAKSNATSSPSGSEAKSASTVGAPKNNDPKNGAVSSAQNSREVDRVISITNDKYLRPTLTRIGDKIELAFSKEDAALFRLPEKLEIKDDRSMARIEAIMRKHDRSIKRLVAYITKNPSVAIETTSAEQSVLSRRAPAELIDLAKNHSRDPELKRVVQNALVTARLEAMDPRTNKSNSEAASTEPAPVNDNVTQANPKDQKVNGVRSKSNNVLPDLFDNQPATAKPAAEEVSCPVNMPDKKNEEAAGSKKEKTKDTEKTSTTGDVSSKPATSDKPQLKPVAPKPSPKFPFLENIPEPEMTFGPKKLGIKTDNLEDAKPSAKKDEPKEEKRRGAIIPDAMLGDNDAKAKPNVPAQKLEKGIHPKLDAWIEANERGDRQAKERTAAVIRNDRKLLSVVERLSAIDRAKLQKDWDGADTRQTTSRDQGIERKKDD